MGRKKQALAPKLPDDVDDAGPEDSAENVADEADEGPLAGLPRDLVRRACGYRMCVGPCQRPKERTHFYKGEGQGHPMALLTDVQKADLVREWVAARKGGPEVRRRQVGTSDKELSRMTVFGLYQYLLACDLLDDLEGTVCPKLAQGMCRSRGYGARSVLGRVSYNVNDGPLDIQMRTLYHRCQKCRAYTTVDTDNPLFAKTGGNRASPTDTLLIMNAAVNGVPQTTCVIQTMLSEKVVGDIYRLVRRIKAYDAVKRQGAIRFGRRARGDTTELEADAHVFFSWRQPGAHGQPDILFYYVWLGVLQRGALEHFWLHPVGVTQATVVLPINIILVHVMFTVILVCCFYSPFLLSVLSFSFVFTRRSC